MKQVGRQILNMFYGFENFDPARGLHGLKREICCLLSGLHRPPRAYRLGLEAQRAAIATYLNGGSWRIVAEFTQFEVGRKSDRPALDKALGAARLHRCPLVVSKVDRLTRSVAFLSRLLEANVDVRFADPPQIEGATGRFLLQQMVAVAELEAGMISARQWPASTDSSAVPRTSRLLGAFGLLKYSGQSETQPSNSPPCFKY